MTRDRDPAGRPRNARPRDALGRPLDPADGPGSGADRIPDDLVITGAEAAALADRLLRDGRPFHAHEVLEAAWKSAPLDERELWRGLAQLAVGLTHLRRGNTTGAHRLLERAADRIAAQTTVPHGIDADGLVAWARAAATRTDPTTPRLRLPPGQDSTR